MLRMHGDLMPIKFRELGDTELESYVSEILSQKMKERFADGHDIDFSYVSEDGGRFRVNVFRKATGSARPSASFRKLSRPSTISSCRPSSRNSVSITRA